MLNRADVRVGPVIGYAKASEFLILLRPAWWVLRGYLVAMAIDYLFDGRRQRAPARGSAAARCCRWCC